MSFPSSWKAAIYLPIAFIHRRVSSLSLSPPSSPVTTADSSPDSSPPSSPHQSQSHIQAPPTPNTRTYSRGRSSRYYEHDPYRADGQLEGSSKTRYFAPSPYDQSESRRSSAASSTRHGKGKEGVLDYSRIQPSWTAAIPVPLDIN